MKIRSYILVLFAVVLFIFSYYSYQWTLEFVDPCCSGLCGQCPPSFWECSFTGIISGFQILIGVGLILIGLWDYIDGKLLK